MACPPCRILIRARILTNEALFTFSNIPHKNPRKYCSARNFPLIEFIRSNEALSKRDYVAVHHHIFRNTTDASSGLTCKSSIQLFTNCYRSKENGNGRLSAVVQPEKRFAEQHHVGLTRPLNTIPIMFINEPNVP